MLRLNLDLRGRNLESELGKVLAVQDGVVVPILKQSSYHRILRLQSIELSYVMINYLLFGSPNGCNSLAGILADVFIVDTNPVLCKENFLTLLKLVSLFTQLAAQKLRESVALTGSLTKIAVLFVISWVSFKNIQEI
jgi:hypothetical protein